jgi:predicted permease
MGRLPLGLRYAVRMLRKSPGFTLIAVAVIAGGIGANTAIFTVVNAVLLKPLPYPGSERIVNIVRGDGGSISPPMFAHWAQEDSGMDELAAYDSHSAGINLGGADRPELVRTLHVSRNYFRLFGAAPVAGRTFTANEDLPGGAHVLLMSYDLWQRHFGGETALLGRTVDLAGAPYTVIGILSPSFRSNPLSEIWLPLQLDPNSRNQAHTLTAAGRLRPDVTLAEANARMRVIGVRYVRDHPESRGDDDRCSVQTMQSRLTGDAEPSLLILLGAVGLVLLIACANVANLLLARAAGRQREMAIRAAVGASRLRLAGQLLAESLLLSALGATLGLALGAWGVRILLNFAPGNLPRAEELAAAPVLDPVILAFTVGLAGVTTILFGIVPALRISRVDLSSTLKQLSGCSPSGFKTNRLGGLLVAGEMALAVVLLCAALLLVRSFLVLHNVKPGFDARSVLSLQASLAGKRYATAARVNQLGALLVERVERVPGVDSAALTSSTPLEGDMDMIFTIPGRPLPSGAKFHGDVLWRFVSGSYFRVLQIPLLAGRVFREAEPGRTVVINEAMARKFWPKENPVGKHILIGGGLVEFEQGMAEIIGIAGDTREFGLDHDPAPLMIQPYRQISDPVVALVGSMMPVAFLVRARAGVSPLSLRPDVEREFLARDAQIAPSRVRSLEQVVSDSMARQSFNLLLLGVFAGGALLLAAVGIYGVVSFSVEQRTKEIGIRSALGAGRANTLMLVMAHGMKLALLGTLAGLPAAFGLTRLLGALLFGVTPGDPVTFAAVTGIVILVAVVAMAVPAVRATRLDPLAALRRE